MLAGVPNGPSPGDQTASLAAKLVAQLHASPPPRLKPVPATATITRSDEPPPWSFLILPARVRRTIYITGALILLIIAYRTFTGS
jgi:hypothetical protein